MISLISLAARFFFLVIRKKNSQLPVQVEYSWTPEQMLGGKTIFVGWGSNELTDMMVDLFGIFVEFFH